MRAYFEVKMSNNVPANKVQFDYIQMDIDSHTYVFDISDIDYEVEEKSLVGRIKDIRLIWMDDSSVEDEILNEVLMTTFREAEESGTVEFGVFDGRRRADIEDTIVESGTLKFCFDREIIEINLTVRSRSFKQKLYDLIQDGYEGEYEKSFEEVSELKLINDILSFYMEDEVFFYYGITIEEMDTFFESRYRFELLEKENLPMFYESARIDGTHTYTSIDDMKQRFKDAAEYVESMDV